jgi:hypothetical protein
MSFLNLRTTFQLVVIWSFLHSVFFYLSLHGGVIFELRIVLVVLVGAEEQGFGVVGWCFGVGGAAVWFLLRYLRFCLLGELWRRLRRWVAGAGWLLAAWRLGGLGFFTAAWTLGSKIRWRWFTCWWWNRYVGHRGARVADAAGARSSASRRSLYCFHVVPQSAWLHGRGWSWLSICYSAIIVFEALTFAFFWGALFWRRRFLWRDLALCFRNPRLYLTLFGFLGLALRLLHLFLNLLLQLALCLALLLDQPLCLSYRRLHAWFRGLLPPLSFRSTRSHFWSCLILWYDCSVQLPVEPCEVPVLIISLQMHPLATISMYQCFYHVIIRVVSMVKWEDCMEEFVFLFELRAGHVCGKLTNLTN